MRHLQAFLVAFEATDLIFSMALFCFLMLMIWGEQRRHAGILDFEHFDRAGYAGRIN